MISTDETALICDLAETYGIFNYRGLPVKILAALSAGLGENSRVRMKMNGQKCRTEIALLAGILDRLSTLVWLNSRDGQNGVNRPPSVLRAIYGDDPGDDVETFNSAEEFAETRERIIRGE